MLNHLVHVQLLTVYVESEIEMRVCVNINILSFSDSSGLSEIDTRVCVNINILSFSDSSGLSEIDMRVCVNINILSFSDSSGLDMLAAASDCQRKQLELEALKRKVEQLKAQIAQERLNHEALQRELQHCKHGQARWTADKIKNQMSYYTGFTYDDFKKILKFLAPTDKVPFTTTRKLEKAVDALSLEQQFLLVMIKLRQNFDFMHLATLFQITATEGGQLFKAWINYMCFRFGEIPSWPDREILIENMPEKFRQDFPLTVAILDSTKIKFKKTRALKMKCQSLFCSDYMSCTTLKGLVAVDPRGAVMFTSILFSGSISDKDICKRSGLLEQLNLLMQSGKLQPGDGIMVDKDFHIVEEIEQLGLKLWIPPSASLETPMSAADVAQTRKIAEHRFVVEKVIGRAKKFKIIKDKVSLNLFPSINKIWLCCCFLTNFMPCLKEK